MRCQCLGPCRKKFESLFQNFFFFDWCCYATHSCFHGGPGLFGLEKSAWLWNLVPIGQIFLARQHLELFSEALFLCVDGLDLMPVHLRCVLWLKCWSAELPCKKHLNICPLKVNACMATSWINVFRRLQDERTLSFFWRCGRNSWSKNSLCMGPVMGPFIPSRTRGRSSRLL